MYLHLGGETVVKISEVIAILNVENLSNASAEAFLKKNSGNPEKSEGIGEATKSLIITDQRVYTSPISSFTLMKRASYLSDIAKAE